MVASPRLNASSSSSSDRYASVPLELAGEGRAVDLATALPAGVDLWRFLGCITTHNELPPWEGTECDLDNLDDSTLPPFGSVAYAKEVYRRRGYLPALVHPREEERLATLSKYGLDKITKFPLQTLTELARNVFQCDSIVVDVVTDSKVQFLASSGWSEDELDEDSESPAASHEIGYCSYAMLKAPSDRPWVMPDTSADVRFKKNPLSASAGGPIAFFASANINLPTPNDDPEDRLPVGSFCLISHQPRPPLTELQEKMLIQMANLCTKEFELAYQLKRNELAAARHAFIQDLFRSLLIYPSRSLEAVKDRLTMDDLAADVGRLTSSDFSFILDTRSFNYNPPPPSALDHASFRHAPPPLTRRPSADSTSSFSDLPRLPHPHWSRRDASVHGLGEVTVMDAWCSESLNGGEDAVKKAEAWRVKYGGQEWAGMVNKALAAYHVDQRTTFTSSEADSLPFSAILPANTTSCAAVPIFDHTGEIALFLIVGSKQRHYTYGVPEERFVGGVGAIVLGSLLQSKILAADEAKLRFVSQVSHELRTPLFSISGNIELVRQFLPQPALQSVSSFLDVADVSLETLKQVLNDVLEFSKLSNQSHSNAAPIAPALSPTDLNVLAVDLIKSCWSQVRQYVALHDDGAEGGGGEEEDHKLEVFFESSVAPGTIGLVDVGGLKRVLINLFGNALKFTSKGNITLRVGEAPSTTPNTRSFRFSVIDTGRGMSPEFIRDSLFTPFAQADSFSCGAGLGVSLSAQLVGRMGGRIEYESAVGKGTTATITLPLEIVSSSSARSASSSPIFLRRNLSEELSGRASIPTPPPSIDQVVAPSPLLTSAVAPPPSTVPAKRGNDVDSSAASPSPLKVLVIDDNAVARRVLSMWLKTKKYEYAEASGGAEAIELFKTFSPNLVWCDIQMPGVDGIEATRQMRVFENQHGLSRARIIALSGLDSNLGGNEAVLLSGQVDHWIVKGGPSLKLLNEDLLEYEERLRGEQQRIAAVASSSPTFSNGRSTLSNEVEMAIDGKGQ